MTVFAADTLSSISAGADLVGRTASDGGTWSGDSGYFAGFSPGGGYVTSSSSGSRASARHSATPPSADYKVSATMYTDSSPKTIPGLLARYQDASNMYWAWWNGGAWYIYKRVSGSDSQVGSSSGTNVPTTARSVSLTVSGTSITLTVDGTDVITTTDSAISAAGSVGLRNYFSDTGNRTKISNFQAETLGGGAITLTGANSSQANTASTGGVDQTHVTTGANAAQTNTSGTGSVSQVHIPTGANSAQANTSSTGSISQTHALVGADATQSNTSGTGAVTQTHELSGANSTQANTSGLGAVEEIHILAGSPSAQANASSAASVSQVHTLTGADCTQANACTTGATSLGITLTGADCAQVNTCGTGAIDQAHSLTGSTTTQAAGSGTGTVTQAHQLTATNSTSFSYCTAAALLPNTPDLGIILFPGAILLETHRDVETLLAQRAASIVNLTRAAIFLGD